MADRLGVASVMEVPRSSSAVGGGLRTEPAALPARTGKVALGAQLRAPIAREPASETGALQIKPMRDAAATH